MAVELKKGNEVCLEKKSTSNSDRIIINLNWNRNTQNKKKGFLSSLFSLPNKAVDLDLGCLYELKSGEKGVVQALGRSFGRITKTPYIKLDKDDRTGNSIEGETITINKSKIDEIKRILIFTYIYDGIANWSNTDAVIMLKENKSSDNNFSIKVDEFSNKKMCAIALLENKQNNFYIQKTIEYFNDHSKMDKAFKWGLDWTPGRKR